MSSHEPTNGGAGEHGDDEAAAMLERFGTTLRSAAVWEEPPDDLGDRIVAQVDALRAGDGHVGDDTPSAPAPHVTSSRRRRRRRVSWLWPGLAVAAAALVAFAAGALLTGDDDDGGRVEPIADVELTATDLAPALVPRARSSTPAPDTRSTSTWPVCRRRPRASTTRAGCTTRRRATG